MKIAFCGDSFCHNADERNYDWPVLVAEEYNAEIILTGNGGSCLYHSLQCLFPVINEADYIVFCITGCGRLANRHQLPLNAGLVEQHMNSLYQKEGLHKLEIFAEENEVPVKEVTNIIKAAHDYFELLCDFNFHHMAQHGILMMIDKLMVTQQKKCIWFGCFDDSMGVSHGWKGEPWFNHYIPKSGPLGDIALYSISFDELLSQGMSNEEAIWASRNDERRNHFNKKNNHRMAQMVIDIIKKDNFLPRPIHIRNYFKLVSEYKNYHIDNQKYPAGLNVIMPELHPDRGELT